MNLAGATSALVLLLAAVAAPSSAAEEQYAGRPPVACVAFESDEENPNFLQMGQCLAAGDAICSTGGSWALGIDPADRMIKLWEGNLVLFASSVWANAKALCIGGNADEYGPHEYNWYDEAAPYLFVSYDAGRSKAFLDCSSGGLASAGDEAHLEINHIAETNLRMSGAPIVAFQDEAGTSSLWSIDAWGAAKTNPGCEWRTDVVGFTAELAAGEDFSSQMDELVDLEQEEEHEDAEDAEDNAIATNHMLRPDMRDRWGDEDKDNYAGDFNSSYGRRPTKWGIALQARGGPEGKGTKKGSKSSPAADPSCGKGKNEGGRKSTKSPSSGKGRSKSSKSPSLGNGRSKSSKGCSDSPTTSPVTSGTSQPSNKPSISPSDNPSISPSDNPSDSPSDSPSVLPSVKPSVQPSDKPSVKPSANPSVKPSDNPSDKPSVEPNVSPSVKPSVLPSVLPSVKPSVLPSVLPSDKPSVNPSANPSVKPSANPSVKPSDNPSDKPSVEPNVSPSVKPSVLPSVKPSVLPSDKPSVNPSANPSVKPSANPSDNPSDKPSDNPSVEPNVSPSVLPSNVPSVSPSDKPSVLPSNVPSVDPSDAPSGKPTTASNAPSACGTVVGKGCGTNGNPTDCNAPGQSPPRCCGVCNECVQLDADTQCLSEAPSSSPAPSDTPSNDPSDNPSDIPSKNPTKVPVPATPAPTDTCTQIGLPTGKPNCSGGNNNCCPGATCVPCDCADGKFSVCTDGSDYTCCPTPGPGPVTSAPTTSTCTQSSSTANGGAGNFCLDGGSGCNNCNDSKNNCCTKDDCYGKSTVYCRPGGDPGRRRLKKRRRGSGLN